MHVFSVMNRNTSALMLISFGLINTDLVIKNIIFFYFGNCLSCFLTPQTQPFIWLLIKFNPDYIGGSLFVFFNSVEFKIKKHINI